MYKVWQSCDTPIVSIVIVSWNVASYLSECLDSVANEVLTVSHEVIVIDNNSSDFSVKMIKNKYPWVKVLINEKNLGYSVANNQAAAQASGTYFLFLNPDTVLMPRSLKKMIQCIESEKNVAIVGPKLIQKDGSIQISCARRTFSLGAVLWYETLQMHRLPFIGKFFMRKFVSPYDFRTNQNVEAISGAAFLIRRDVFEKIGGFCETYFHCGEDIDLFFRTKQAGFDIRYFGSAEVLHYGGQSTVQAPIRTNINATLSNQEYFLRCHGPLSAICYRIISQLIRVPMLLASGLLKLILKGDVRHFKNCISMAIGLLRWRPNLK
jgi:GT2 family glycosyltransferase